MSSLSCVSLSLLSFANTYAYILVHSFTTQTSAAGKKRESSTSSQRPRSSTSGAPVGKGRYVCAICCVPSLSPFITLNLTLLSFESESRRCAAIRLHFIFFLPLLYSHIYHESECEYHKCARRPYREMSTPQRAASSRASSAFHLDATPTAAGGPSVGGGWDSTTTDQSKFKRYVYGIAREIESVLQAIRIRRLMFR